MRRIRNDESEKPSIAFTPQYRTCAVNYGKKYRGYVNNGTSTQCLKHFYANTSNYNKRSDLTVTEDTVCC